MIHVHELKSLKLYNKNNKLIMPLAEQSNKTGSAVFLLTPNIESSVKMINSDMTVNRNWFKSYYLEKSIDSFITPTNEIGEFIDHNDSFVDRMIIEGKLPTERRNKLKDKEFGIPSKRKYPLNDADHVKAAIRMFNHVDKEDEALLAKNIIKKIKKFDITDIEVGKENRFYNYYQGLKEYEYNTYKGFTSESFTKADDIKAGMEACSSLYYSETGKRLSSEVGISSKIKYLGMTYDGDDFVGFITGEMASRYGDKLQCYVYISERYLQYETEIITGLVLNLRGTYMRERKGSYADIYYLGTNDEVMKNIAITFTKIIPKFKDYFSGNISFNPLSVPINSTPSSPNRLGTIRESCKGDDVIITNEGIRSSDRMIFFDDDIFNETSTSIQNAQLKKILYPERIRKQKDVLNIYNLIKQECSKITFTYLDINKYKAKNVFIDTSYYNKAFFANNTFTHDKGIKLYGEFLSRVTNRKKFENAGYTRLTIFVPIMDWYKENHELIDYTKSVNPISALIRLLRTNNIKALGDMNKSDIVFFGDTGYFRVDMTQFDKKNLSRLITNINSLIAKAPIEDDIRKDSPDAITTTIIDKLETNQKINLHSYSLTGKTNNKTTTVSVVAEPKVSTKDKKETDTTNKPKTDKEVSEDMLNIQKGIVVDNIKKNADNSNSIEDALKNMEDDTYIANIIKDISDEENKEIKVSSTRSARINKLNDELMKKTVKGQTVKQLVDNANAIGDKDPLPTTKIDINSINKDQWDNLQYINFNKEYNIDEDIMSILQFFGTRTVPVSVRDVKVEDTSTSEDLIETWTVQCEDLYGSRFTLKFDIPKFKNNRFMRLRGNDKTINGQLMNLPIIKTEKDVCQITTNYNKIFFRVFGSSLGKSNVVSDMILKTLSKYQGRNIKVRLGSNNMSALKYDLPFDYVDLGRNYSTISCNGYTFYFNQDEIRTKYEKEINLSKGLPVGYGHDGVIYYNTENGMFSTILANTLCEDKEFEALFAEAKPGIKYYYSKASIMSTTIPVIVIMAYCEGLTASLKKAGIKFTIEDKRSNIDRKYKDVIKFNDAYIVYDIDYSSSLLMNGLKECNTEDYSIKEADTKAMWTEMLDKFGGRLKADGLDNFYDLMFDPISIRTCEAYDLPSDFCTALVYSSNLLADSKYNKHVDITGNRFRTNELIAGYTYRALAKSYADYRTKLKKTGKATMSIKQSAIIDAILTDNTTSDASTINDLCYAEAVNTVSFKGLSGMNSERSYSLDKRTYDNSMNGILAMSTGFASTVGETRQATVNMAVQGKRGYIKDTAGNTEIMNDVNSMCIAEALTPLSTTHDDPFREAMSFTQRTKHDMRVSGGDPLLITNGMDDALSNFTPDVFSINAKEDGKIVEKTAEHIVIKYKSGNVQYIDLNNKVYKNSDGGFYTAVHLKVAEGLGTTVKAGQLIAYDPMSYTTNIGYDNNASYNQGTIAKIAILTTDEGFEDSCAVDRYLSNALSSKVVTQVPVTLSKNTNVFNLVKVGDKIQEGEPLMVIQNAFEDEDVNILLKNLVDDEDLVTSLGRIPIKSHCTGQIEDIKIYRTVEINQLSPSLQKIVKDYENKNARIRKTIEKYDPDQAKEYVNDYKLDSSGKLKNVDEGVLIEIYTSYQDDFSVGDKLIVLGAQKGVAKEVFEIGNEPRSSYRPEEPIDCMVSMVSFDKRMITAPILYTMAYKFLIELDRQVKDILGIKYDATVHHKDLEPDDNLKE